MHLLKQHTPASQAAHVASHRSRGPPACSGLPSRTRTSTVVALAPLVRVQPRRFQRVWPPRWRPVAARGICHWMRTRPISTAPRSSLKCMLAEGGRRKQRLCWSATLRQPSRCATMQAHCTQGGCEPIYIRAFRLNPTGTVCAPGARRAIGGDEGQSDGHAGEPWRLDLRAPYHGVTTTTATQATDSRESQMCVALHEPCTYIEVIVFDSRA